MSTQEEYIWYIIGWAAFIIGMVAQTLWVEIEQSFILIGLPRMIWRKLYGKIQAWKAA